jgi:sarcosine oxidase, subunit beta
LAVERFGTVVIGGGIVGTAVAYYLAQEGEHDILLLERSQLASGSTGGSFGGVRQQFSTPLEIELSRRGLEFWKSAAQVFDWPVPFYQDGYLFVTGRPDILGRLAEAAELQRSMGLTEVAMVDAERLPEIVPWLDPQGLLGGCHTPGDGRVTPPDGVAALARAARRLGVRFQENFEVASLQPAGTGWRIQGPEMLEAERVVVCTGYWSSAFMRPFGLDLTIRPMALYSALTEPALQGQPVPLTIDLDTGFVVEREGQSLVIGILLEENPAGYGHEQMLVEFAELARQRAPVLGDVRIARQVVANVDLGGDGHPYVGEVEPGLWMAAGFGGHGTMHGPVVARLLAGTIAGRPDPSVDLSPLDPRRSPAASGEWMVAARKD